MLKVFFKLGLVLILLFPLYVIGQGVHDLKNSFIWFDKQVGKTNLGIFKGVAYKNPYRAINERNQFFNTADFILGSLLYNDQPYYDIPLRYDVYNDQLLIQNNTLANTPIMIFDRAKVPNFSIGKHYFDYIERELPADVDSGFFELVLEKDMLQLYKKHTKKIFKRTDNQTLYYEFKNGHYYMLRYMGEVYRFKKANELGRIFSGKKKEIKLAAKRHKDLKVKSADAFVIAILNDLSLGVVTEKKEAQ